MRKWRDWRDGKNDKNRGKTNDLPRGTGADSQPGAPSEPQDVNFQQGAPGERRDEGSHGPSGMHVLVTKALDEEAKRSRKHVPTGIGRIMVGKIWDGVGY